MFPVFLYAKPGWLPPMHQKLPNPLPPEMHFTKWLVGTLQEIVPSVLLRVDEWHVAPAEVLIIPELFHPWAVSTNDMFIDIQPPDITKRANRSVTIRDGLYEELYDNIFEFWRDRLIPKIGIAVRPTNTATRGAF